MTGTQATEVIALVEQLQGERDELRDLLRTVAAHVGETLPADLLAEIRRRV